MSLGTRPKGRSVAPVRLAWIPTYTWIEWIRRRRWRIGRIGRDARLLRFVLCLWHGCSFCLHQEGDDDCNEEDDDRCHDRENRSPAGRLWRSVCRGWSVCGGRGCSVHWSGLVSASGPEWIRGIRGQRGVLWPARALATTEIVTRLRHGHPPLLIANVQIQPPKSSTRSTRLRANAR
jgi:hypothetical protein